MFFTIVEHHTHYHNYNDSKVTITLKEYDELILIKRAMEAKPHIVIISSFDGYKHATAYTDKDAIKKLKDALSSVLDDYYGAYSKMVHEDEKIERQRPKKTWVGRMIESL